MSTASLEQYDEAVAAVEMTERNVWDLRSLLGKKVDELPPDGSSIVSLDMLRDLEEAHQSRNSEIFAALRRLRPLPPPANAKPDGGSARTPTSSMLRRVLTLLGWKP